MAAALHRQGQLASGSCQSVPIVRTPAVSLRSLQRGCFQAAPGAHAIAQPKASRANLKVFAAVAEAELPPYDKYALPELQGAEKANLPKGFHFYETMIILRPTFTDEERDKELAKFEAFLNKEECLDIRALVRGRSRMAYPIKGNWEGIYVLYYYAAKRSTAKAVQLLLSNPEAGSEGNVMRHITLCRA